LPPTRYNGDGSYKLESVPASEPLWPVQTVEYDRVRGKQGPCHEPILYSGSSDHEGRLN